MSEATNTRQLSNGFVELTTEPYSLPVCECGWPFPTEGLLSSSHPISYAVRIIIRCPGCRQLYTLGRDGVGEKTKLKQLV